MKVGILTLNLHTNYGGILQAYALQTVLKRNGHNVEVIHSSKELKGVEDRLKSIARYILYRNSQQFIKKYINQRECNHYSSLQECCFDAIVVGSDQVWRPMYFGFLGLEVIEDAFLQFASDWNIKRIAYAPSFGTDQWEYTSEQRLKCALLLQKFDQVSVREDSAVRLCKTYLGVDAEHVIDPTMLLSKEDYIALVEKRGLKQSAGDLFAYILDANKDIEDIISKIADTKSLSPFSISLKVVDRNRFGWIRRLPSIECWLRSFMDAKCVVADSFHACVFSIIFNKPFVAYGNKARGEARFKSLLTMFGLESQYVTSFDEFDIDKCTNIDWNRVNTILEEKREAAYLFLNKNL